MQDHDLARRHHPEDYSQPPDRRKSRRGERWYLPLVIFGLALSAITAYGTLTRADDGTAVSGDLRWLFVAAAFAWVAFFVVELVKTVRERRSER
jgi:hypothetical protein